MQLFEKKSFTRLTGYTAVLTYCFNSIWTVTVLEKAMPDMPVILAGLVAVLYGLNKVKQINATSA